MSYRWDLYLEGWNEGAECEGKVAEIYGGKVRGGSAVKSVSGFDVCFSGDIHVYEVHAFLLGSAGSFDLYILPDVFQEYTKDVCAKPALFKYALPDGCKVGRIQKETGAAQGILLFQVPDL